MHLDRFRSKKCAHWDPALTPDDVVQERVVGVLVAAQMQIIVAEQGKSGHLRVLVNNEAGAASGVA
jgi:hypothetical protein